MKLSLCLLLASSAAEEHGRQLVASAGCNACCFSNDCRLAFAQTQPGVCCRGVLGHTGCCPLGASCVACANIWKCSRSTYLTRASRCRICADDMPRECMYQSYSSYHHGGSMLPGLLLLFGICAVAGCLFYGRGGQDEVIVVQQPQMGYAVGPNGQMMGGQQGVVVVNQGGGYGGGGMVAGAATGFVGGMMVGEMMDHGGGGYGGGYGGGGYGGGDMGGGDSGFMGDQ